MDLVLGRPFVDCFDQLTYEQKTRTATDLVNVVSTLYTLTSSYCGSMIYNQSLTDDQHSPRYGSAPQSTYTGIADNKFMIGPFNDITFLELPGTVPASSCGPFRMERSFLEAITYRGSPPTRSCEKVDSWPFEKLLEVYDAVRPLYSIPGAEPQTFHFSHGDLSRANILLDPATGAVAGIIDWEMSGFRPAWLVAAGPA
jgi:Phosphotransferase enzyme family